jgi:cation diffusion facilitator CzcD-associated flavoprotein CzcO
MCKRLVVSPHYYEVIQQAHVTFETGAVAAVEPNGIRMADETFHALDVIVLATGFAVDRFIRPTEVRGRGGVSLDDVWAKRPAAYNAIAVPDFPNLFFLNGPSAPVGNFSLIKIAEFQWNYIVQLLQQLEDGAATEISATPDALADYERRRIDAAGKTVFSTGCTSWYLDKEGVPSGWPWSYGAFVEAMKAPRREDFRIK